ncbi:F0F1 ATP synthase subunit delta [Ostreiculturibacter nitratireducens]|uniref:F0F1 ATP synthase subunit delta n=1 Tax=Ostreiculturibacter nitratireducens TaxID=3075226 RepID=UPI0031B5AA1A
MQIDWWTLAIQTINFIVVVWLLTRFLYRPVKDVIAKRQAIAEEALSGARKKTEEAEEARRNYEEERSNLAAAQREREAELHTEMEKERQAAIGEAKKQADHLLADAKERIEREREEALDALREEITSLAADLAAKALAGAGMAGAGEAMLERVARHLSALPEKDLTELKEDAARAGASVVVTSAAPIPDDEQSRWRSRLRELIGQGARIEFEVKPEIIGGVELHFAHGVLSFSIAEALRAAAERVRG